jgi:Replication initiator protein A
VPPQVVGENQLCVAFHAEEAICVSCLSPVHRGRHGCYQLHLGGAQRDEWAISLELLKKKCGSASEDAEFRRLVGIICKEDEQHGHIPDYALSFDGDMVRFVNRNTMKALPSPEALL